MKDERLPPAAERLRAWLEFYDELGLTPLYRRRRSDAPASEASVPQRAATLPVPAAATFVSAAPTPPPLTLSLFEEAPPRREHESLEQIRAELGECTRCKLSQHRRTIVFGEGSSHAQLVFVGEGPGAEEDAQGRPFVGRAGQLLTHWIESLGLKRSEVYICNVIKCRPPGNRTPERDEIETCSPFLFRQLESLRPKLICCLGSVALQTLLGKSVSITRVRGQFFDWRGLKLFATFHPAYLLRNPGVQREVQEDLRRICQFLG
ncbi:MAG: uracil-DNA glycosylase [Acidobacteria bacterium]|nr:uracil-DNA glycosylase [Acidobacteriota bacterium]